MLRPVKDPSDRNHYLKPELTRKFIRDHHLSFEDIKKELPKLKSKFDPNAAFKDDVAFDKENKAILKGPMVRDTVECDACGFV